MTNMRPCRYPIAIKFPLKLNYGLLLLFLNGLFIHIENCECTVSVSVDPLVVDEGSRIDTILTQLGLKKTLVTNPGENPEDKTFFGEDSNGTPIVVGSWFDYGSYTLAVAIFGTTFLMTCIATAVYYVLFVVTEPSQLRKKRAVLSTKTRNSSKDFSIVKAIGLAYETYQSLDFNDLDCQKKILCELQIGDDTPAKITREVSTLLTHLEILSQRVPNMKDFKEAIDIGQKRGRDCSTEFANCRFSLANFNHKFKSLW